MMVDALIAPSRHRTGTLLTSTALSMAAMTQVSAGISRLHSKGAIFGP